MKLRILLLLSILALGNVTFAQDEPFKALASAKSIKCFLTTSGFGDWKDGKAITQISDEHMEIIFDSIDLKEGKARMIGNQSATDVFLKLSSRSLNKHKTSFSLFSISGSAIK